jgi:MEMO1 family protein
MMTNTVYWVAWFPLEAARIADQMNKILPRLRRTLDIMPSPVPESPGFLIRDPLQYSEDILIIPPLLARGLALFDGVQTEGDLRSFLSRLVGQVIPDEVVANMVAALGSEGFLENEEFDQRRQRRHGEFAAAEWRIASHAGTAYPGGADDLRAKLDHYTNGSGVAPKRPEHSPTIGIAAPHVSPEGGWRSYAAAYSQLRSKKDLTDKTFVVLGTSHYGTPERFGLTRKPYATPLGNLETDRELVDWMVDKAGESVILEDYCHAVEHSIEFQCVFLRHALGRNCRILPVLCGPLAESLYTGQPPETNDDVRRFLDVLRELSALKRDQLFWVLGVDMAHIGRRYGDPYAALSSKGVMSEVEERDAERLLQICDGNIEGFFDLVSLDGDDLKWCGYSPFYTFLYAVPEARGTVLNYEQWNIDDESVVTFAGIEFHRTQNP